MHLPEVAVIQRLHTMARQAEWLMHRYATHWLTVKRMQQRYLINSVPLTCRSQITAESNVLYTCYVILDRDVRSSNVIRYTRDKLSLEHPQVGVFSDRHNWSQFCCSEVQYIQCLSFERRNPLTLLVLITKTHDYLQPQQLVFPDPSRISINAGSQPNLW